MDSFDVELFQSKPVLRPSVLWAVLLFAVGVALIRAGLATLSPYFLLGALGFLAHAAARRQHSVAGKLSIMNDAVYFEGTRVVDRAELATALILPSKPPVVQLRGRRRVLARVKARDERQARDLVRALGLGVSQRVASFELPGRNLAARSIAFFVSLAVATGGLVQSVLRGDPSIAGVTAIFALVSFLLFVFLSRTELRVGSDGLTLRSAFGERFIRYDVIARVEIMRRTFTGILLTLRSGEHVRVPTSPHPGAPGALSMAIALELRRAIARVGASEGIAEAGLVARAGRAPADWLHALRSLGTNAQADHRTAPMTSERLWRIVEDPGAAPSARAGAAVVLASAHDADDRNRLRVIAQGVASPDVQAAFVGAVSSENEADLAETLEAIDDSDYCVRRVS